MTKIKDIDKLLDRFIARGLPGCSLHVMRNGEILYEGYRGVSNLETMSPITKNSVFRLASMSKIPLYTMLMKLYEQGRFLMDDPISYYLPAYQSSTRYEKTADGQLTIVPTKRPLIIKDVLTMKCGLPYCNSDYPTDDPVMKGMQECMRPLWKKGHFTLMEQLDAISKAPLACEPGTDWIYGFSSEIAAGLIEVLCDQPANEVLQKELFEPLEMKNTGHLYYGDIEQRMVSLYAKNEQGALVNGPDFFDKKHIPGKENEQGHGRLFSTGEDLSHFMQMLACGGTYKGTSIIGRKTIDLMRTNTLGGTFSDSYNAGYGYGYGFRTLVDHNAGNLNGSLGSFGWTGGFGTYCEADPSEGLSIVYMHNLIPNEEQYYHPRVRNASYGLLNN